MASGLFACLTAAILGQISPRPLDAFRGNMASLGVEMSFVHEAGVVDRAKFQEGGFFRPESLAFERQLRRPMPGRWATDGRAEMFDFSSPSVDPGPSDSGSSISLANSDGLRFLFDGETLALHNPRRDVVDVTRSRSPGALDAVKGPFHWGGASPFPLMIDLNFPDESPTVERSMRDGYVTEVEIYERALPGARHRVEVHYDPSVGYLPRYCRRIVQSHDKNVGYVMELYLCDTYRSRAGAFVPTEWIETSYTVDNFEPRYRALGLETPLAPTRDLEVGHFKASRPADRAGPVRLDGLDGVRILSTFGGAREYRPGHKSLTLDQIKSLVGGRLDVEADFAASSVDQEELQRYSTPRKTSLATYALVFAGMVALATFLAILMIRKRRGALAILLPLVALVGCREPESRVGLSVSSEKFPVLFERQMAPLTLIVKNTGDCRIVVRGASGGCSCRQVDTSRLPVALDPGTTFRLPVLLHGIRHFEPQRTVMTFDTDRGSIESVAEIFALPRHRLSPQSISHNGLFDGEDWSFELVHREVLPPGRRATEAIHVTPPAGLTIEKISEDSGRVAMTNGFMFRDTTYQVTVLDPAPGYQKRSVAVVDKDGAVLAEAPVAWDRRPFLSPAPHHVILGVRPMRCFLRCPDETVELTSVVSTPSGVKAVVSSPREVTIDLEPDAPPVISGVIQVSTTAIDQPPLSIPVARYSSRLPQQR